MPVPSFARPRRYAGRDRQSAAHCPVLDGAVLSWPALVGGGLFPLHASVPNSVLALMTTAVAPLLLMVAPWDPPLAPNVTPELPVRTTWPANWLPAQPPAG